MSSPGSSDVSSGAPAPTGTARHAARMIVLFALLGVMIAAVAGGSYRMAGEFVDEYRWVVHTYQVKEAISATVASLRSTEAAVRAYALSGANSRLAEYYTELPTVSEHSKHLRDLVADNAEQAGNARAFEDALRARRDSMAEILDVYRKGGIGAVQANPSLSSTSRQQDALIDDITERMISSEDALLRQREAATLGQAYRARWMTAGAVALCLAMLLTALVITLREHRRRMRSERQTAASYADLELSLASSTRLGERMRQLTSLGEMLQGCRTLDEAAEGLQAMLRRMFPDASGNVALVNASGNLVETFAGWGDCRSEGVFSPDECWALRRGRPHPESDHDAFACKHIDDVEGGSPFAPLCVPLMAQGTMLGALILTAQTLSDDARDTAIATAEQISLAVANLRLQDTLRTQSLRDPLTNLFNRRYLEVSLSRDLARAVRRSQPLAVLMLDVDHFKTFNDTRGHDAGDAVLANIGELLGSLSRSEDVCCRYGGEEFTLILMETDAAMALDRAEEVRRAVETMDFRVRGQPIGRVTISVGIASYPQHGDTPEQLLKRADRALYVAKNSGRNCVCVADR